MSKIKIVRKASERKDINNKPARIFILGIVDKYSIPKGKTVKQFEKELYKIARLLHQSDKVIKYSNTYIIRLVDYIFGTEDVKPLIKIVYSKNQILILFTSEYGRVRGKVNKGDIMDILVPALTIMRNKRKIKNFIIVE